MSLLRRTQKSIKWIRTKQFGGPMNQKTIKTNQNNCPKSKQLRPSPTAQAPLHQEAILLAEFQDARFRILIVSFSLSKFDGQGWAGGGEGEEGVGRHLQKCRRANKGDRELREIYYCYGDRDAERLAAQNERARTGRLVVAQFSAVQARSVRSSIAHWWSGPICQGIARVLEKSISKVSILCSVWLPI